MKKFKTPQENFWAGNFGNKYLKRNNKTINLRSNENLFNLALNKTKKVNSCIELGAGAGKNLICLKKKYKKILLQAVEINSQSAKQVGKIINENNVFNKSIIEFKTNNNYDLVLVKGVLMHISPKELLKVYNLLFKLSKKYILICDYYNPSPISVVYRSFKNKLFKRDFAGEMLKKFKRLKLIDYGFVYKNDPKYPLDDVSWFLLKK